MKPQDSGAQPADPTDKPAKKPYVPPAVVSEEVFETLALSCAKSNPFVCPGGAPNRS